MVSSFMCRACEAQSNLIDISTPDNHNYLVQFLACANVTVRIIWWSGHKYTYFMIRCAAFSLSQTMDCHRISVDLVPIHWPLRISSDKSVNTPRKSFKIYWSPHRSKWNLLPSKPNRLSKMI